MIDIYPIVNAAPSVYREPLLNLLEGFLRRELTSLVVQVTDTSNPDYVVPMEGDHYFEWNKGLRRVKRPTNPRQCIGCWMRLTVDQKVYPWVLMSGPLTVGLRQGKIEYAAGLVASEFTGDSTTPRPYELYTGIGSRDITGTETLELIALSKLLSTKGFLPRSGHAIGSDYAVEIGARYGWSSLEVGPEIFLPYDGFNGGSTKRDPWLFNATKLPKYQEAQVRLGSYHNLDRLKGFALAAHTRNMFQVLGSDLASPSKFLLVCADPTSKKSQQVKGGTGTAVRVALDLGVPVYNLRRTPFAELKEIFSNFTL